MRISDWSSDVCSSDLCHLLTVGDRQLAVLLRSQAREEITEARLRCGGAGEPVRIKRAIVADDPCRHGAPPPVLRAAACSANEMRSNGNSASPRARTNQGKVIRPTGASASGSMRRSGEQNESSMVIDRTSTRLNSSH